MSSKTGSKSGAKSNLKVSAKASAKSNRKSSALIPKKSAIKKYADANKKAAKTPKKTETPQIVAEAPVQISAAIEENREAATQLVSEDQLQKELEAELEIEETPQEQENRNKLVRDDFSPVNASRDKLIVEYAPLIKYIAQKIAARLPANIELDDLISSGVIGLMDAIDKYDSSRDNKFKTYAEFRIRGAILDELRAQDWVPRSVREKAKMLERAYSKIEQEKGRQATDEEVCETLKINQEEYHDLLNQVRSVSLLSFDDLANFSKADKRSLHGLDDRGPRAPTPFSEVTHAHFKRIISKAIEDLPEKQRLVLSLYYFEDLNLKEIGRVLDVTESRVSQLHTQAIIRMKGRLRTYLEDFTTLIS